MQTKSADEEQQEYNWQATCNISSCWFSVKQVEKQVTKRGKEEKVIKSQWKKVKVDVQMGEYTVWGLVHLKDPSG